MSRSSYSIAALILSFLAFAFPFTELASQKQPFPFKVMYQKVEAGQAAAHLRLVSEVDANKKLAPKTVLWMLKSAGSIKQTTEKQGVTWSFTSTKT